MGVKSLRHFAMVAKFLDLNKPWSCKYGKKACMTFLRMIAINTKPIANTFLPSLGPSKSRKVVEIQKCCYHGSVTPHFSLKVYIAFVS